jgi:protein involved in polysaccharide export with SLBB domain
MALLNPWKLGLAAVVMAGVAGTGAGVWTLRARAEVPPAQPETARQPPPQAVQAAVAVSQDEARRPNVVRTQNFAVMAPTAAAAQRVAVVAERERKAQALRWLGREMPPWPKPCPVSVNLMPGGAGGATKFNYDFRGGYEILGMDLTGELDRILKSTLPHEVTHTVLADYFRRPVPRWADEGAATLAESGPDQETHEQLVRQYLAKHKTLPLRRLFDLKDYTDVQDVLTVYAQGYSVTRFLVGRKDHATFLRFVEQGLSGRWDAAAKACYDFNSVQSLEAAWLADLDRAREAERPVPLAHLRQKQPDSYLLDAGDVLGVFVEGVLGERGQDPPLIRMTQAVPPGAASLPPALGYPIPVQEGGTLILPRIEPLAVRGKSINQAHDSIRAAYQRAQAVQPGARILVTLARRRTYRVTVIRRDKPADDPRRPVATTLDLPAYENDVLEALARSGGLPGWDANQVLVIERDRAATAGAEPQRVRIPLRVRPGQTPPFRPEDVILKNGDTLVVGDNDTELSPVGGTTTRPSRPAATTAARAEPPRPTDEPAPLPAVASLDPQGRIYAVWSARYMVSLPVPPPPKGAADGQQGAAPLYQVRIEGISSEALIEPERLRAFTADGKPVSTTALVERVREPTQVLVTWVGSLPDPFHRRLLKDDTLILLMPAAAAQPKPAGPAATPGQ